MTTKSCGDRKHTPIVSQKQQRAMGAAYAAKKGESSPSKLKGAARSIYASMNQEKLKAHLEESAGKKLPVKSRAKIRGNALSNLKD